MIHGSTSFNFCWSTNVEHCWTVYHSNFKNKASSWKRQGNSQLMKRRNHGDSRQHGKLSPELARVYSLVVPSFAAIYTRALSLMSRFLWSFDLTSYRHGKVSYRLISWLVLSKLQSNSAASNSSAAMLIFPGNHVTPNSKTIGWSRSTSSNLLNGIEPCSIFVQQHSTTFNMLNGIFQHSTTHDTLFNICWTAVSTFVAQQMLTRVSFALGIIGKFQPFIKSPFRFFSDSHSLLRRR